MKSRRALQVLLPVFGMLVALCACNNTSFYTALGNKIQVPALVISPATATVPANGSTTFSASGGVPPYAFSITSGPGSIVASTGVYTAPAAPGVAIVQVKDKQGTTATAVVNPVTYAVTAVNNTGLLFAGGTASGTFTIQNRGSSNGTQTISWSVYASPTSTLGSGSALIASNTTAALSSLASTTVPFAGTWPTTPGSYYLIASISSPDSSGAALPSAAPIAVSAASVDYQVTLVSYGVVSTTPGGAVNGTFTMKNNGPDGGTQNVTWQAYASTTTTITGSSVLITSGPTAPLASGASTPVPIAFSGAWPLTYGNYYLVVKVSVQVDVDTNFAHTVGATSATTPVGIYAATEPNQPAASPYNIGVALQPGMSISVTGSLPSGADPTDFLEFNTGTAVTVTFTATWSASSNMTLSVYDLTGAALVPPATVGTTPTGTSLSLPWTVDLTGTPRLINLQSVGPYPGPYALIITAN